MPTKNVFIRTKKFNNRVYYYIVEAFKDGKNPKQRVIKYLGKMNDLLKKMEIAENCLKKHNKF